MVEKGHQIPDRDWNEKSNHRDSPRREPGCKPQGSVTSGTWPTGRQFTDLEPVSSHRDANSVFELGVCEPLFWAWVMGWVVGITSRLLVLNRSKLEFVSLELIASPYERKTGWGRKTKQSINQIYRVQRMWNFTSYEQFTELYSATTRIISGFIQWLPG